LGDEIIGWRNAGIDLIVSLLEKDEASELGLLQEPTPCHANNMDFVSFPIPDRGVPASIKETEQLARRISIEIAEGRAVAIHCRAGIGRSSLIAACVLLLNGSDADSVLAAIAKARGVEVPDTEHQRAWVSTFQAAMR
jgi:protein-tyrosine phosphatase